MEYPIAPGVEEELGSGCRELGTFYESPFKQPPASITGVFYIENR
jgi:hypothetical protein